MTDNAREPVAVPVRNVELYKNGMGFFEHLGSVQGAQAVEISLPGSQLDDVLKSLTVLDLSGGKVAGVTYDSVAPLDRRLAELPINLTTTRSLVEFLNQIRGAGIEIKTPSGLVAGRLMNAEVKTNVDPSGTKIEAAQVSLIDAEGQIHAVSLETSGALRLTDATLAGDLNRTLGILDSAHQRDVRKLRIQTAGTGQRQIYIGYTSESPIWKTTYRIVLDPKQKPLLQGWAIVDNTTPMDWTDVTLSLVAGAPISFVQKLSQPIYASRPEVPIAAGIQATPQMSESVMDMVNVMGAVNMAAAAPAAAPPPPLRAARSIKRSLAAGDSTINEMRRQQAPAAQAQAVGEQFEYKLSQPVTIRRNESALLPILQADIDGEKVSVFNSSNGERNPRLAFWLKNSSGLTLDGGAVTLIDSNAFAGEGLISTIQPGESRLLGYAIDQGMEVAVDSTPERGRMERIVINGGMLSMHSKMVDGTTYRIRNNNDAPRTLILEQPIRQGWMLTSPKPEETSASFYRFRVHLKAKSSAEFTVREETPQEDSYGISSVSPDQIALWVHTRSIDAETEKQLRAVAAKQAEVREIDNKVAALDKERDTIFKDQERVRENLQRLGQSPDEANLRQRYIRQLDTQEDRVAAIKAEREKLQSDRAARQKQLEDMVNNLSVDRKL